MTSDINIVRDGLFDVDDAHSRTTATPAHQALDRLARAVAEAATLRRAIADALNTSRSYGVTNQGGRVITFASYEALCAALAGPSEAVLAAGEASR